MALVLMSYRPGLYINRTRESGAFLFVPGPCDLWAWYEPGTFMDALVFMSYRLGPYIDVTRDLLLCPWSL
jgi:hypothetical protein